MVTEATKQLNRCCQMLADWKGATDGFLCFIYHKEKIALVKYRNRPNPCQILLRFESISIYTGLKAKEWNKLESKLHKIFPEKDHKCQKSKSSTPAKQNFF